MPIRRTIAVFGTVTALLILAAAVAISRPDLPADVLGGTEARGANADEEALEQRETVDLREEALADARSRGVAGRTGPIRAAPVAGWAGEQPVDPNANDWEPAIAADPSSPNVYVLVTRYGAPKACNGKCPTPAIFIERSTDGGQTWTNGTYLCTCRGVGGQFDPIIEVVPNTGHVYASWMNDSTVVFSRSTDHGATWSAPVSTRAKVQWNDKPVLAASDDGRDVYVSWNGPSSGDMYVAQSHDFGATWTQKKIVDSARYFFAYDGDVLPNGTVVLSESSISYTGPGVTPEGLVQQHVFVSTNAGSTWQNVVVDSVEIGEECVAPGCSEDFYLGHSAISSDANGRLVVLYDGATTPGGRQRIFVRRSMDGGSTWTARTVLSNVAEHATAPAAESRGTGDVRAWYYETNGGNHDAWNVWYRSSTDGGVTWSSPAKISDATSGAGYKSAGGFLEVYGDYGEMAITSAGKAIGVWGEGFGWSGPGGSWYNRQT